MSAESLLPLERLRRIEDLVVNRGVVRVTELSEELDASEVTIRKDLRTLERRGILERTRGGALSTRRIHSEVRYTHARGVYTREKEAIGRAAAALVQPGDLVFLSGGTTTLEVFRHITAGGVTVVTNNMAIPPAFDDGPDGVTLIVIGGHYRSRTHSAVGPGADDVVNCFNASRAFVGADGVSLLHGATTTAPEEADIARKMIARTRGEVSIVVDHSKLGQVADCIVADLDAIDRLIVDEALNAEYRSRLDEQRFSVEIVTVDNAAPS